MKLNTKVISSVSTANGTKYFTCSFLILSVCISREYLSLTYKWINIIPYQQYTLIDKETEHCRESSVKGLSHTLSFSTESDTLSSLSDLNVPEHPKEVCVVYTNPHGNNNPLIHEGRCRDKGQSPDIQRSMYRIIRPRTSYLAEAMLYKQRRDKWQLWYVSRETRQLTH